MKYCKKCKHLYNDEDSRCTSCKKGQLDDVSDNTPVYLLSADGFELTRVKTALEDNGIPCDTAAKKHSYSAQAVTGYDSSQCDLLVPFSAYQKAYDICVGIGAIESDAKIVDEESDSESVKSAGEAFEEMSGVKRTTVRIVSAILLILIFCAVIWGTDFVTSLIKNLL